jgi:poly-gamma-glutamate synthesis protein (capsule biosynthesis protein)
MSQGEVPAAVAEAPSECARGEMAPNTITLFLCGDVMTGRGVDQVLPHPGDPRLHEPYVESALRYVELAQATYGPFPRHVGYADIWGDALDELERRAPDARIVNLETAVTRSDDYARSKSVHYRMHPLNVPCLTAAKIDCCVLANNHVLDWGRAGLEETLATLAGAKLGMAGAGQSCAEAEAPAVVDVRGKGRVIVFGLGSESSGIPGRWAATEDRPGVNLLEDFSARTVRRLAALVREVKRARDIVVASIHWGENWGYGTPREQVQFAHALIGEAGVDIVHGHSSHHVKAIEVYQGRPVLYGCGDFLTDYEGIGGYEEFRNDLGLMYFVTIDPSRAELVRLEMTPTQMRRFRVNRAPSADAQWLADVLSREGARFGTRVEVTADGRLALRWP